MPLSELFGTEMSDACAFCDVGRNQFQGPKRDEEAGSGVLSPQTTSCQKPERDHRELLR